MANAYFNTDYGHACRVTTDEFSVAICVTTSGTRVALNYGTTPALGTIEGDTTTSGDNERVIFNPTSLSKGIYYFKVARHTGSAWEDITDIQQVKLFETKQNSMALLFDQHYNHNAANPARMTIADAAVHSLKPDVVVLGGDEHFAPGNLNDQAESDGWCEELINQLPNIFKNYPVYRCYGNHEGMYGWDATLKGWRENSIQKYFCNPNDVDTSYSFVVGDMTFVVIHPYPDNETDPADETEWHLDAGTLTDITNLLDAVTTKWCTVICHQLIGGTDAHGRGGPDAINDSGTYMGDTLWPLLIEKNVDWFFYGHDHVACHQIINGINVVQGGSPSHSLSLGSNSSYDKCRFSSNNFMFPILYWDDKVSWINFYQTSTDDQSEGVVYSYSIGGVNMQKGQVFTHKVTLTGSADQLDLSSVVGSEVTVVTQLIMVLEDGAGGAARVGDLNVSAVADPNAVGYPLAAGEELTLVDVYYPSIHFDGTADDVVYITGVL
jgi:predicted phosphodiesterase